MSHQYPVVAIVDDEAGVRTALGRLLRARGYGVASFERGEDFLSAPVQNCDCVILDLHMPGKNGFAVLEALVTRAAAPPVVVITGHDLPGSAEHVIRLGACAYLTKPVDEIPLICAIEKAVGSGPFA